MADTRRTILRRGLLLMGGAAGAGIAGRRALGKTDAAGRSNPAETMQLWGKHWSVTSTRLVPGQLAGQGDRLLTRGVLLDAPDGEEVGEFFGTLIGLSAPGHDGTSGVASLEQHTFNLADGSIMGSGTGTRDVAKPDEFAIVGGVGRFAGASGAYVARQSHWEFGGNGTAEFTLTILGR